ncbi:hypothetical protein [Paludisphaera mucosa]|uniref:Uncharacterized protein n=1 Tax=Paludisphaera mucosa TaxID=3030827 RepID=A0ABT6F8S6_9BACT|nr:hypothetical protein [Paludisphaera mucosa]MDG3003944.1 hypothetical protein [Paludisphaera mucosa]
MQKPRLTVLDVVALVIGAAVALMHLRPVVEPGFSAAGLFVGLPVFLWLAATASGPCLAVARRFGPRKPLGSRLGEGLWTILGTPWLLSAAARSMRGGSEGAGKVDSWILTVGLAMASCWAAASVYHHWIEASPEDAAQVAGGSWSNRVGMILAIAWPIQGGLALIALS